MLLRVAGEMRHGTARDTDSHEGGVEMKRVPAASVLRIASTATATPVDTKSSSHRIEASLPSSSPCITLLSNNSNRLSMLREGLLALLRAALIQAITTSRQQQQLPRIISRHRRCPRARQPLKLLLRLRGNDIPPTACSQTRSEG